MRKSLIVAAALWICGLGPPAISAEAVPKSGSVQTHAAFYFAGTVAQVGDNHTYVDGPYWGVSFNDAGSGFLHQAAWHCPGLSEIVGGKNLTVGLCTITDGDRGVIYGTWGGNGPAGGSLTGKLVMTGGTGSYKGITGLVAFKCDPVGGNGRQLSCVHFITYQLP